jgi:GntR family transcriptional regulator
MFFKVQSNSGQPLFLQLMQQIKHAVENGTLHPGEQLPSIRTLAEQLVISPNTVIKAYSELAHEGVLELIHGSGAFVNAVSGVHPSIANMKTATSRVNRLVDDLREKGFREDEIRRMFEAALLNSLTTRGASHE